MLLIEKNGVRKFFDDGVNDILPTFVFANTNEIFRKPYSKSKTVMGIGKVSGDVKITMNGNPTPAFRAWKRMLNLGSDVGICDDWLQFEVFNKWYLTKYSGDKNYNLRVVIPSEFLDLGFCDKYCQLLPDDVVRFFNVSISDDGLPKAIKRRGYNHAGYNVQVSMGGRDCIYRCYAKNKKEAIRKYNDAKRQYAEILIDSYSDLLDTETVDKLISFRFVEGVEYGTYIG